MKIIACSDQHLGYVNADKVSFNAFLDDLMIDPDLTTLVLLGDVVDMWRRDASGVFLENWDTIEKIQALRPKVDVHYVAGNHDFHVLQLQNHSYPFQFEKSLTVTDQNHVYRFQHGYEFDPLQHEPIMEALCKVMSDGTGNFESEAWAIITKDWSSLEYLLTGPFKKHSLQDTVTLMMTTPEVRLQQTIQDVDRKAYDSVQPGEMLVYGHTHRPFVSSDKKLVNIGSWVTDSQIHNTYLEISNGNPRLLVYGGNEILERAQFLALTA
jgi:UDP-2,3-diacylglucosamine pyrophosphatase LpxH